MSLVPATLASVLDPMLPVAVLGTMVGLLAALAAVLKKRVAAAVGWLLLSACCALYAKVSPFSGGAERPNEGPAIGNCRAVNSAEVAYSKSNGGFFGQLSCLESPTRCGWAAGTTPFLDAQTASLSAKQGYARSFIAGAVGKGKPDPGIATFLYITTPVVVGKTGNRGFAIDHTGLICFTTDGSVPPIANGALAPACTPLK